MPEPGIGGPDFDRPTTARKRLWRPKQFLKLPAEFKQFRLEDGSFLGEVLGDRFFGPASGSDGGKRLTESDRERLREGNSPIPGITRNDPRIAPQPETAASTPEGTQRTELNPGDDARHPYGKWTGDEKKRVQGPGRAFRVILDANLLANHARDMEILWGGAQGISHRLFLPSRQQDADLNALPSDMDHIENPTRRELDAIQARNREEIRPAVERWVRNSRALEGMPDTPDWKEDPGGSITGKAAAAATKAIESIPLLPGVAGSFRRALVQTGYNPGDVDDVMEALEDPAFWSVLNRRRADSMGNAMIGAGVESVPLPHGKARYKAGVDRSASPDDEDTGFLDQLGRPAQKVAEFLGSANYHDDLYEGYKRGFVRQGRDADPRLLLRPRQQDEYSNDPSSFPIYRYSEASQEQREAMDQALRERAAGHAKDWLSAKRNLDSTAALPSVTGAPGGVARRALAEIGEAMGRGFVAKVPFLSTAFGIPEAVVVKGLRELGIDPESSEVDPELLGSLVTDPDFQKAVFGGEKAGGLTTDETIKKIKDAAESKGMDFVQGQFDKYVVEYFKKRLFGK